MSRKKKRKENPEEEANPKSESPSPAAAQAVNPSPPPARESAPPAVNQSPPSPHESAPPGVNPSPPPAEESAPSAANQGPPPAVESVAPAPRPRAAAPAAAAVPTSGSPGAPGADSSLERVLRQILRLLAPPTDPASFFTDADREAIAAATGRAESQTSAEIRLAVVARCRRRSWYLIGQSGVAIAAAAVVASALLFFFAGEDPEDLYGVPKAPQSSVSWGRAALDPFLVTGLSLAAAGAGWFFAAYGLRAKAIRETADRIWTSLRMEQTRERTGILLLVALEERLVRIHVDRAIAAKLPPDTWKTLVGEVASGLSANEARPGAAARAAAHAIEEIGGLVAKDLPRAPDDVNELPDEPYVESK